MEKVRLRVKTVPVSDPVAHETYTLYTVLNTECRSCVIECASGMSVRDAISTFCSWFRVERSSIELVRPFLPHGWEEYGDQ